MATVYLSPANSRFPIATERELSLALEQGLLNETHYLDLKREVEQGSKANKELARDLASFAIDGGALVVGVEEREDGTPALASQSLAGLPERVEQVARMNADPPLAVTPHTIPTEADPSVGYLLVQVPVSPTAPHMVDGKYIGRGETQKRYLPDAEVVRLHQLRRATRDDALTLLDGEFARDPIPAATRNQAHLFLLAQPVSERPEMLREFTTGEGWQDQLVSLVRDTTQGDSVTQALTASQTGRFSPDLTLDSIQSPNRRANGVALSTHGLNHGRNFSADSARPESVSELEVGEDGSIRAFLGRFSERAGPQHGFAVAADDHVLFDQAAVTYTRRFLAIVAGLADAAPYHGNWLLAVGATGLYGCYPQQRTQGSMMSGGPPYNEDTYRQATEANYTELTQYPGWLANQLVGKLLRTFGTDQTYAAALSD